MTIIKLHGDYADLDKRNTVDELATYPPEQDALLRRVLDEYGLIISGWSGEWDIALVRATEEAKSRRYPMFWASYRKPSEAAGRLIAQVGAVSIENTGAEDLFVGLRDRLQSLDKLSAPPMSREMAVVRLKRNLPDPVHRIDTHDVMMDEVKRVEMLLLDRERYSMAAAPGTNEEFWARYDDRVTRYRADVDTLLHLLAAGAYFAGPEHNGLWTSVIQRLLSSQTIPEGGYNGHLFNLSQYPTLLAIHVVLAVGALAGRDDLVGPVLARPSLKLSTMQTEESAAYVAHPWRVFENDAANALPRFGWLIPASTLGIIVGALTIGATYPHGLALSPLFGLLILGLAKGQGPFVRVLAMPKMVFGGEVSYSLYMTHMLVLAFLLLRLFHLRTVPKYVVLVIANLLLDGGGYSL